MKIKGAIFDVDGTLLDSMYVWNQAGEKYLKRHGITPRPGVNEEFKNQSLRQAADYLQTVWGLSGTAEEIMSDINKMIEEDYFYRVNMKEGAAEFLEQLKMRGVSLCLATATDRHLVEAALRRNRIADYFPQIFTCTEVGHGKDEPDIFKRALRSLGTSIEETVIFEDALYAVKTAKNAGFTVAAMYDSSEKEQQAMRELADFYFKDFKKAEEIWK